MPIPTLQEIDLGFDSLTPTPLQVQQIQEMRTQLVVAAEFVAQRVNDNRLAIAAIHSIQLAFSQAKSSILTPPDLP